MLTDTERKQIIELHNDGAGYDKIAKELDISMSSVRFVLKNNTIQQLLKDKEALHETIKKQTEQIQQLEKEIRSLRRKLKQSAP